MIGNHLSRFRRIVFGAAFGLILFGYDRGNAQDEGAIAGGERPQLEAAIKYLQKKIKEEPPYEPKAPPYPDKSFDYPEAR